MAFNWDLVYLSLTLTLFLTFCTCLETHTVATEQGDIIGFTRELVIGNETSTTRRYLGIPYAKPPVGERRFKKPQEPEKFTESFEALEFGASCPQPVYPTLPLPGEMSEDCLFMNIFVPTTDPDQPSGYPVMIFVHGGGFDLGTGAVYVGDTLAAFGNVIVVTFNYRLGLFGFFSTKDENAPGNAGLWDQHMAFKWVNKNIWAFGGDKNRVTIFGQSAGATAVMMQALYPANKGLFQRVIAESGTALMWTMFHEDTTFLVENLADNLKCDVDDVMTELSKMNSSEIMEALPDPTAENQKFTFRPSIDNDFFKISPFKMSKNKDKNLEELNFFRSLDVVNGVCNDESATTLSYLFANGSTYFLPTREMMGTQFVDFAALFYANTLSGIVTDLVVHEYTVWSDQNDPKDIRSEMSRLLCDVMFNVGAVEQSRMHFSSTTSGRNYFYIFDTDSEKGIVTKPSWSKGAVHGDDLGFVFGFDAEMMAMFNMPLSGELGTLERELTERVMRFWSKFAAYGNPNGPEDEGDWPQFNHATQKAFVISEKFTSNDAIKAFPYARAADFWLNIVPRASEASMDCSGKGSSVSSSAADHFGYTLFSKLIYITIILTNGVLITFLVLKP